jgi:hypothetical protein
MEQTEKLTSHIYEGRRCKTAAFFLSAILNQEVIPTDEVIAKIWKWW